MKILIAEDDITSRRVLEVILQKLGYDVIATSDGNEAWEALHTEDAPPLAILDWLMPGMNGIDICAKIRSERRASPPYIILLTMLHRKEDIVVGFRSGADDYITKPFDSDELCARVQVGKRIVELRNALAEQIQVLQDAIAHIRTLQGILPICMHCHKIRDDHESWQKLENYIQEHSDVQFSHGLCPECLAKFYPKLEVDER